MNVWDTIKRGYEWIPALWRDVVVAIVVIMIVMGGLWVYTGQPISQAPLVVVESGSMMHPDPPYGRLGTIDPGDLILVKASNSGKGDIVTMYGGISPTDDRHPGEGDREGYGHPGDVVIYRQDQCPDGRPTPIIHRAITWVEVENVRGSKVFSYHDEQGRWQSRVPEVHLPEIQITNERGFDHSGWVTKGDNPQTNRPADQNQICRGALIQPDWLVGKARGEIPWIGLLKFIIQGNNWQVSGVEGVCVVGNAKAPCDAFVMLWVTLGVLVLVPLAWDVALRVKRRGDEGDGPGGGEGSSEHRPGAALPPREHVPHHPRSRPPGEAPPRDLPARPKPRWAHSAEEEARREERRER